MALRIDIDSAEIRTKSGTSSKNNKPYTLRLQFGYVHLAGERYPVKIELTLSDEQPAYAPGSYTLSDGSFFVGRFDRLELGRLELEPLKASVVAKAA